MLQTQNGASLLVEWLKQRNIRFVFLVPGAQIAPLLDALAATDQIQMIIANHELGAAYMADGYARATKQVAMCLSIGGPGASNMLTAAIAARMDNSRVLFITGNMPVNLQGIGGFQDGSASACRDNELFDAALGHTSSVTQVDALIDQLNKAWDMMILNAVPVHVSVPKDIQTQSASIAPQMTDQLRSAMPALVSGLQAVITALNTSKKIVLLVGQRLYIQESAQLLESFAKTYAVPVVTTLAAKGIMAETHLFHFGNSGYGGNAGANAMIFDEKVDLILIIGAELRERDTLGWDKRLHAPGRRLIRIDSVPTPESHPYQPDLELVVDSFAALLALIEAGPALSALRDSVAYRLDWVSTIKRDEFIDEECESSSSERVISLARLIQTLQQCLPDDSVLVADAGTHRKLSGRYWQVKQHDTFFNPTSTAPMGWGIAAAIGVQLAKRKQRIVSLTGDGCMRMHGIEIATAARYQIPVLFVICNNASYACTSTYIQPNNFSLLQLPDVDWVGFAAALGVDGIKVNQLNELQLAIEQARTHDAPFLIEVMTPPLSS